VAAAVGAVAGGAAAFATVAGGVAAPDVVGAEADGAEADRVGGASRGVLCTALRGAGDGAAGGAVTAGMEALATGAAGDPLAGDPGAAFEVAPAGGGGGAVPTPNKDGEAVGDDGSASGAASAVCWALVRSAISESVSCFISA
jgi:hypothetical protein